MVAARPGALEGAPRDFVQLLSKAGLMSALGHKPTYAVQKAMSALAPIATAKADFRKR
jgi:hypothetical protein